MATEVIELKCKEARDLVEHVASVRNFCVKIGYKTPACKAVQVLEAIWRLRHREEVALTAEALGLDHRHAPFLLRLQQKYGAAAVWEDAVVGATVLAYEVSMRQFLRAL